MNKSLLHHYFLNDLCQCELLPWKHFVLFVCLGFFGIAEVLELETGLKKLLGLSDDSMTVIWFILPSATFSLKQ